MAYAQSSGQPAFGDQMQQFMVWASMKYVLFLSFWGCLVRLLLDLRSGRIRQGTVDRFIDTLVVFVAGFTAGFCGFAFCEYVNSKFFDTFHGRVIPDLVMCAIIASAAINREVTLRGLANLLRTGLDKIAKTQP
jgi:hypothetical protein